MKLCRIGIIGAGRMGQLHAENICNRLPQFKLEGIADPYLDLKWAQQLNIPFIATQAEDLIQHPDLDAILIASPAPFHIQQVMMASKEKKAVFCEKPLGLTEEEIESCLKVVEQQGTLLQIGFNRRFDPSFANLYARVRKGEVGIPHLLRITSRDPAPSSKEYIKTSGGIFMDMAIHDFDMARFLMGSEIVEVYAQGSALVDPYFAECHDVDTATIQLRFLNGALGVIDNSRQAVYGYDQRVEVFGSKGALLANNQFENTVIAMTESHTQLAKPLYFFLERYQEAFIAELHAFHRAWMHDEQSPVSGQDGLQALRIARACKESLETRKPITLHQVSCMKEKKAI